MVLTESNIEQLKSNLLNLTILFNNISNKVAKENRILEKNNIKYKNQIMKDTSHQIQLLRNNINFNGMKIQEKQHWN